MRPILVKASALLAVLAVATTIAASEAQTMKVGFHNYGNPTTGYHLYLVGDDGKPIGEVKDDAEVGDPDQWGIVLARNGLTMKSGQPAKLLNVNFTVDKGAVSIHWIEGTLKKDVRQSGGEILKAGSKVRVSSVVPDESEDYKNGDGTDRALLAGEGNRTRGRIMIRDVDLCAEQLTTTFHFTPEPPKTTKRTQGAASALDGIGR